MGIFDSPPGKVAAMHGAEISARSYSLQREANELFGLYGRAADAPRADESDEGYQRRLLDSAKRYSTDFCNEDFSNRSKMRAEALPILWKNIVSAGVAAFKENSGELRQVVRRDQTGRERIEFYGGEKEAWLPFCNPDRKGRINTAMCSGKNAPGVPKPKQIILDNGRIVPARG